MIMKSTILTVTVLLLAPLAALHTAGQERPVAGQAALDICSFGATSDERDAGEHGGDSKGDRCLRMRRGANVVVPAGVSFTGSVRLKSRVVFVGSKTGATLRGSPDIREFTPTGPTRISPSPTAG